MANADRRAAISQMLANIAGILLAGAFTFLVFVLDKRTPGIYFWICFVAGIAAIVLSVIFGGRGMDSDSAQAYDRQAKTALLGFVALAVSLFFLGPVNPDDNARINLELSKNISRLEAQLEHMKASNASSEQQLKALSSELANLKAETQNLSRSQAARKDLNPPQK